MARLFQMASPVPPHLEPLQSPGSTRDRGKQHPHATVFGPANTLRDTRQGAVPGPIRIMPKTSRHLCKSMKTSWTMQRCTATSERDSGISVLLSHPLSSQGVISSSRVPLIWRQAAGCGRRSGIQVRPEGSSQGRCCPNCHCRPRPVAGGRY